MRGTDRVELSSLALRGHIEGTHRTSQRGYAELPPHPRLRSGSPWLTLFVVAGGLFLVVLSTTMVSVALPTIGHELHASPSSLQWIIDSYVLVYAGLVVPGGAINDRHGRKGIFMLGVGLFAGGSVISGIAPTVGMLLAGRVLQGVGPALLISGGLTIVRARFEEPRLRAAALGVWSMASGVSMAVGPVLGGVIVSDLGWRWVFLINAPLAAVLLALSAWYVPRLDSTPVQGGFDWLGAILTTFGIGALAYGIIRSESASITAPSVLASFAAGVGALAFFVAWEHRQRHPLVDLELLINPVFFAASYAAFTLFFALGGAVVYFSAYFQLVQNHSPISAGADISAIGIAFAITSPVSGRLVGRIGTLGPILAGLLLAAASMLALQRLGTDTPVSSIWWGFALFGVGIGASLAPATMTAVSAVASDRAGIASALYNAVRQVGQIFGVAVLGLLIFAALPTGASEGASLRPGERALFVAGLHDALWVTGAILLSAAAIVTAVALSRARHQFRPHEPPLAPVGAE